MSQTSTPASIPTKTQLTGFSFEKLYDDSVSWLETYHVELLIAVGIGALIFLALGAVKRLAKRYIARNQGYVGYRSVLLQAVSKTSRIFLFLVSAEVVVAFSNAPDSVRDTTMFLFTIAAVVQVAVWVRELILGFFANKLSHDPEQHETLESAMVLIRLLVTFLIFAIATIVILSNLGVNVTGLVAGLGVGGIAIGLAAQGIFSDLFAALSIIFDNPFRRGDAIGYDNTTGSVEKIGLKSTRIRAFSGEEIIISNTNLLDKEVTNWTRMGKRRARLKIGVIYQTSPEKARAIPGMLSEIVEKFGARTVRSGFVGFGDSSIDFELDFDTDDQDYEVLYKARHEIGLEILQRFNDQGYEFAYPTQTSFAAAPDGTMIMPYPEGGFPVQIDNG